MSSRPIRTYNNIVSRTADDTGIDKDTIEIIARCMMYEIAEELVQNHTIELPYIGDISLRTKKLQPNKFLRDFNKNGGSNALKFKQRHAETIKRSARQGIGSSGGSEGRGADRGESSDAEDNQPVTLPEV